MLHFITLRLFSIVQSPGYDCGHETTSAVTMHAFVLVAAYIMVVVISETFTP